MLVLLQERLLQLISALHRLEVLLWLASRSADLLRVLDQQSVFFAFFLDYWWRSRLI
jgi:hypothetical protein